MTIGVGKPGALIPASSVYLKSTWEMVLVSDTGSQAARPGSVSSAERVIQWFVASTTKSVAAPAVAQLPPTGAVLAVRLPAVWSNSSRAEKAVGVTRSGGTRAFP